MRRARCAVYGFLFFEFVLLFADAASASAGPVPPAPLPQDEIVSRLLTRNAERATRLQKYASTRDYDVAYNGIINNGAKMTVTANFDHGQKDFKITAESGSKLLLSRVLHRLLTSEQEADATRRDTALTRDNYSFKLLGTELKDDRACYLLAVTAKRKNKYLYNGKIWVDAVDFAVVHVEAHPAVNPSFWISETNIEHRYQKIGDYWLPASNQSVTKVRVGGNAVLNIHYSNYHLGQ